MTDHETRTEAEAREAARAEMCNTHSFSCAGITMRKGKYLVSGEACDCGAAEKPDAVLDAYAEAVRAAERARVAAKLATWGASVRKVDVLRLLTEDTPR